ncbi:LysR family transcriptional regulator, partial [Paenibacillus darwinianus]
MELRQLQYVVQIAAEKNFSRAAEKLHIAQPSLSQQLSKLEKEIGVPLFRRTTNNVELTHAGVAFVTKAEAILDAVDQLRQEMDDLAHMRKGRLVVGCL